MLWKRVLCVAAALAALACCEPKPDDPAGEDGLFLVNGISGNSSFTPSADPQTLRIKVVSTAQWSFQPEGAPPEWITTVSRTPVGSGNWLVSFELQENTTEEARTAVFVFSSGKQSCKVTISQSVEDPLFRVGTEGAYGVPGGDITRGNGWQFGRLQYGGGQNFHLVNPQLVMAATLSGLPLTLVPGQQLHVLYRLQERGLTRVCVPFQVQVIRVREDRAWLKASEETFFVIAL